VDGKVILVALGSNLYSEAYGEPQYICEAAIRRLETLGLSTDARSRWYRTAPVPVSDQPWFVNGVISIGTSLDPACLLSVLHRVEDEFGRTRRVRNEARVLDLDLLAYDDLVLDGPAPPLLPHPRLHERAFVLLPLADIAPDWRHPRTGADLAGLVDALPPGQRAEPME
jgi:2-amino-4-hydroxy-6-hydroxymethyldihydropteridine diphosphokinase